MIRAILVVVLAWARLSPAMAAIEYDGGDRAAYIATFQGMIHDTKVFDLLGNVSKLNNVCTLRLLTALGIIEITFEVRNTQGYDYIHVLSKRKIVE